MAASRSSPASPINPFISHAFLKALEDSGSATRETGWLPQHLLLEDSGGHADRLHALLSEIAQPRRICVRPWLGRRLSARRRPLLSEAASLDPLHAGDRAAPAGPRRRRARASARRCCCRPPCRSPTGSASPRCTSPSPRATNGSLPASSASCSAPTSNSIGRTRAIASFDDFLASARLAQAQGDPQGTPRGARRRHRDRMGDGKRSHRGALGRLLRLLHGHRLAQMGLALSDARVLQPARREHGRPDPAHPRQARRPLRRRRAQLDRRRRALRPLLGRRSRTTPSCISRSATTRPSSSPSRTGSRASRPARKARTSSPAAICRARPTARITSPTRRLRRAVADYLKRERRAVAREIALLTEESPYRNGVALTLEHERDLAVDPIFLDLAVLHRGLEVLDPDGADIAHGIVRPLHRGLRGILPALVGLRIKPRSLSALTSDSPWSWCVARTISTPGLDADKDEPAPSGFDD